MKTRTVLGIAAMAACWLAMAGDASAQSLRAKFSFEGTANCTNPAISGFPIHGEGTGVLSTDRSAKLDLNSNIEGPVTINAKLGAKASDAPGGSASLRVAGRHTLRAVRNYPNNSIIIDLTVVGNSCSMKVVNVLKPGKREYTFYTGSGGFAYCSAPQITRTECSSF
jgi:hypothetical protein